MSNFFSHEEAFWYAAFFEWHGNIKLHFEDFYSIEYGNNNKKKCSCLQLTCFHWHFRALHWSVRISGAKWLQLAGGLKLGGGAEQLSRLRCIYTKPAFVINCIEEQHGIVLLLNTVNLLFALCCTESFFTVVGGCELLFICCCFALVGEWFITHCQYTVIIKYKYIFIFYIY